VIRGRVAGAVAVVLLAGAFPAGAEDGAPVTGWWSRTTIGAPSPVEAPLPHVPEGGTYVAGGSGGALAVSALRVELGEDETASELALEVADVRGTPVVTVCPAAARWGPAQGGRFDDAPPRDCTLFATGTVTDGRLVVPLDGVAQPGPLDVVLLPAEGSAFSLSMQPATADSVTVAPAFDDSPLSELPPMDDSAFAPAPGGELPAFGSDLSTPPLASGAVDAPLLAGDLSSGVAGALPETPDVASPQAAAPPPRTMSTRPSAAVPLDDRQTAVPAAMLLLGLAALAMKLSTVPARAPVALGGAARLRGAAAGAAVGAPAAGPSRGVGRFRRERTGRPTPL
jgi:hypothetical protein